jgi:hypothetical protein
MVLIFMGIVFYIFEQNLDSSLDRPFAVFVEQSGILLGFSNR